MRPHKEWPKKPHQRKKITANNVLITSKAGIWELLVNYFKQHYGNEVAIVTYRHTVGENGLRLNRPRHYYQIVQEVLYQHWFRWHVRWYIVGWTAWQIWHWLGRRRWRRVWWHMNRYNRCSMKIVMMMNSGALNKFADFSASYTRVRL